MSIFGDNRFLSSSLKFSLSVFQWRDKTELVSIGGIGRITWKRRENSDRVAFRPTNYALSLFLFLYSPIFISWRCTYFWCTYLAIRVTNVFYNLLKNKKSLSFNDYFFVFLLCVCVFFNKEKSKYLIFILNSVLSEIFAKTYIIHRRIYCAPTLVLRIKVRRNRIRIKWNEQHSYLWFNQRIYVQLSPHAQRF